MALPLETNLTTNQSWTEKEVETFCRVMTIPRLYKKFSEIQKYLPEKTTQDIVEYYYYWKLTQCDEEDGSGMSLEDGDRSVGCETQTYNNDHPEDPLSSSGESRKRKRSYLPEISHEEVCGSWDACPKEDSFDLTESPSKRFKHDIDVLLSSGLHNPSDIPPLFGSSTSDLPFSWLSEFNDSTWGGDVNTSLTESSSGMK